MRWTVAYLIESAMGKEQAVHEEAVVRHINKRGISMTLGHWREHVLGYLLENVVFIGTFDGRVFLIIDEEDARVAEEALETRVELIVRRLAILRKQANDAGLLRI